MPDSVTLQFRGLVAQDFMTSSTFATTTTTLLGLGAGITVTPMVVADSDAAAAAAGAPVGAVYVNNGGSFPYLRTRMT